ncbi:MAG TPA: ATP-binding protein, partial [Chloroflexota bacterium]
LHKLTAQQSSDLYDVIIGRHRQSSLLMTSNRDITEWVALFDDPILANSALDRLAHRSHQLRSPPGAGCGSPFLFSRFAPAA